jgi:hypothetical protein
MVRGPAYDLLDAEIEAALRTGSCEIDAYDYCDPECNAEKREQRLRKVPPELIGTLSKHYRGGTNHRICLHVNSTRVRLPAPAVH